MDDEKQENDEIYSSFNLGQINDNSNSVDDDIEFIEEGEVVSEDATVTYCCASCGCSFSVQAYNPVASCVFCGSSQVAKVDNVDLSDYQMLTFIDTLSDAKKDYKREVIFNPLIPKIFKKDSTIKRMKRVYLPCMLYDLNVGGNVSFYAVDKIKSVKNAPVQAFECGFSTNFDYDNLINCSFSLVSDEMFSTINQYNYSVLRPFDVSLLKDSYCILHDEDNDKNLERIENRASKYSLSIVRDNVGHELKKVKENNMKFKVEKSLKVLVPIYMLNVRYKGRTYLYLKNGQTGETAIDVAYEKKNIIKFSIIVFITIFVLVTLLAFLF